MKLKGFLNTVVQAKKEEIDACKSKFSLSDLRHDAEHLPPLANFASAMAGACKDEVGIIAEIKKASPSKGDIGANLDVASYVEAYTRGGAAAVSVLTESRFFKGSLQDLMTASSNTDLPVLRKDFIFTDYQIYEAKKAGASAVLLITTLLSPSQQAEFTSLIRELGMEPLVEINSEWEFEQAYTSGAKVVGINNRNLQTLEIIPDMARRVAKIFPEEIIPVEASGISGREGIEKGIKENIFNFLVGESIVRAKDTKAFIMELCGKSYQDSST